ncbi:MAG: sugar ABC transporter permease, partial [Deinococcus sp.]|nr:sugar ABC transporter permease [Deinococcus sp.]
AGRWSAFRHVTLPLLSPTLFFLLTLNIIESFQAFGQIHTMTNGGPSEATNVLVYSLYRDGFEYSRTGSASAQAYLLFVLVVVITLLQFKLVGRRVHYQ